MKAPLFWQNPADRPGLMARLLQPLGWVYAWATARRLRRSGAKIGVPVVCIGNLTAGGSGKTPTTILLAQMLHATGKAPHAVLRGYGGTEAGPLRVDPLRHRAAEVGDEALLLAEFLPTWVSRDRAAGAASAVAQGAEIILLDDGFQNPTIEKDLSILVVDAARGFGNGLCIPAGPLREPIATGLQRADLVLTIGQPADQDRFDAAILDQKPRIKAQLVPLATGMDWQGAQVIAFAGIGYPEKFFESLRMTGAEVLRCEAFADHQALSETMLWRLKAEADFKSAQLVTTEKDAVRLPPKFRAEILTFPVRLVVEDQAMLQRVLSAL